MLSSCAHGPFGSSKRSDGVKLSPEVVEGAVTFETGTKDGAVIPEVSSPRLRAVIVEEKIENNRLIERHREWILEGEVQLLGIPKESRRPIRERATP